MKKTKIFLPLLAAGLVLGMGLAACNNTPGQSGGDQSSQAPASSVLPKITVTAAEGKKTLIIGETVQLTADVEGVTWESGDAKVATVDTTGKVTAVAPGEVSIKAIKEGYKNGSIGLTVTRPAASAEFDLTIAAEHYSADGWWELGGSGMFSMQTIAGWNPIAQTMSWGQETEEPAETFIGGFGIGDKETVKFTSSKAVKGELVLNIGNSNAVTLKDVMGIKLNGQAVNIDSVVLEDHPGQYGSSLEFGELSLGQLDLAAENTLEFEFLADTNIFLDEVAVYAGDATVALTAPAVKEQIVVTSEKLEVIEGQTVAIETAVQGVSYVSLDETVATVDDKGVVTGVKTGIVKITVKKDGMYSVRVEVTVKPAPVAGQILIEAESAEELQVEELPQGIMIQKDGGQWGGSTVHSGSAYVMIFSQEAEIVLTYKFQAQTAGTMTLSVVGSAPMSMGGDAAPYVLKDSMAMKLNDTDVAMPETGEFPAPEGWSSTMAEVAIGDVAVNAGENTLVVTLTGSYPSLDVFKLSVK